MKTRDPKGMMAFLLERKDFYPLEDYLLHSRKNILVRICFVLTSVKYREWPVSN